MAKIILCHGINQNKPGKDNLDSLLPYLGDHDVVQADYGPLNVFQVRYFNNSLSNIIAGMAADESIGIGHSNGCALLLRAARKTSKITRLILINPALDDDAEFPDTLKRIDVFHNKTDLAVWYSKFFPFHEFGEMGRVGYTGKNSRVFNHETTDLFGVHHHSDVLKNKPASLVNFFNSKLNLSPCCSVCGQTV